MGRGSDKILVNQIGNLIHDHRIHRTCSTKTIDASDITQDFCSESISFRYSFHSSSTVFPVINLNTPSSHFASLKMAFTPLTNPSFLFSTQSKKYPVASYPSSHLLPLPRFQCGAANPARSRT